MTKIIISDNRNETILETTSETFRKDLLENKDKLNIWWTCNVRYEGEIGYVENYKRGYFCSYPCIVVNGRNVLAKYNYSCEDGQKNFYDELLNGFIEDFETVETYRIL